MPAATRANELASKPASPSTQPVAPPLQAVSPVACMPRTEDYTHMWWAEGFPGHTRSAPWLRCVQTGLYAIVLDTRTLGVRHFGPVPPGMDYAACARADNGVWQALPPAELTLDIAANGKTYRCIAGGDWTAFGGPRIVESGRFFQRADVTDLVFAATDGSKLNVEARFEAVAWPDRLSLVLSARPGVGAFPAGEPCFGRLGGGFGLSGSNHLEVPHSGELDSEQFTLELWAYVPVDCQASPRTPPWLVCKNRNEATDGNYGIVLLHGRPQGRLNIGGGRDGQFTVESKHRLNVEAWNQLVLSYDGRTLRLYLNGTTAGEREVGRKRSPGRDGLAFGRRQDNDGDGYRFRGAIDEIRYYSRALTEAEVRRRFLRPEARDGQLLPVRHWSFAADGQARDSRPREDWARAAMEVSLRTSGATLRARRERPVGAAWNDGQWQEVHLALSPATLRQEEAGAPVTVQAAELPGGGAREVRYDPARGWHCVSLNGVQPLAPASGGAARPNDAMERVRLALSNPSSVEQSVRLMFEKTAHGIRHRFGSPITGISAVLRDAAGRPTGIPVQLSKNWHNRPEGGVHAGAWFHGISQVRLPARSSLELELSLVYGHWGGVPAASHAQLCLIGWGSNQLWDESALGSWGESICYEPDQAQAHCAVLDVRPVLVGSMHDARSYTWTHNVGGGDFVRLFDERGQRVFPSRMKTAYHRQGPCLTEVTYAGRTGRAIQQEATVSLCRGDDIVRGVYRLRMDAKEAATFSRLVLFQIGADTYSYTGERMMALGNESGLTREWATRWGGGTYRTAPMECAGQVPWLSLHQAVPRERTGSWANRGIVIRSWRARLGGRPAAPWAAEYGVRARGENTSTIDIVPPPGLNRLEAGDYVEAIFEHIVVPRFAQDYLGPSQALRAALERDQDTWRMIHREAVGNDRKVKETANEVEALHPAVRVRAADDRAALTLSGGLSFVPVTITNLSTAAGFTLLVDDRPLDQSVHGNDFWQADYDAGSRRWSLTFNIPAPVNGPCRLQLKKD